MTTQILKNLRKSALGLSIFLTTVFAFSASAFAKPVVLYVSVIDGLSTLKAYSSTLERMFQDQMPEAAFRKVLVEAPGIFSANDESKTRMNNELKEKLSHVLEPGDEIAYLILDSHGNTKDSQTILGSLGQISADGPDTHFRELFDVVKDHTRGNLNIMLNACSVFADSPEQSSLRAKALLDYFNAPDGVVYGSKNPELHMGQYPLKYSLGNDFIPTKQWAKLYAGMGFAAAVLFFAPFLNSTHSLHAALSQDAIAAGAIVAMMSALRLTQSKILDWLKGVNVGYLFRFQKGRLESAEVMQKFRDIARTYNFKKSSNGSFITINRCEAVFE